MWCSADGLLYMLTNPIEAPDGFMQQYTLRLFQVSPDAVPIISKKNSYIIGVQIFKYVL
jgi:hypothetical protein